MRDINDYVFFASPPRLGKRDFAVVHTPYTTTSGILGSGSRLILHLLYTFPCRE